MQFKVPKEKKKDFVDSRTEEFNRKMKKKLHMAGSGQRRRKVINNN